MNAFGYWMYLMGGLVLYAGFFTGTGPDAGWFSYPPLSGPQYSVGKGVDIWAQMITYTEISALCVATELIATLFKMVPGEKKLFPASAWRGHTRLWTLVLQCQISKVYRHSRRGNKSPGSFAEGTHATTAARLSSKWADVRRFAPRTDHFPRTIPGVGNRWSTEGRSVISAV